MILIKLLQKLSILTLILRTTNLKNMQRRLKVEGGVSQKWELVELRRGKRGTGVQMNQKRRMQKKRYRSPEQWQNAVWESHRRVCSGEMIQKKRIKDVQERKHSGDLWGYCDKRHLRSVKEIYKPYDLHTWKEPTSAIHIYRTGTNREINPGFVGLECIQ